MMVEWKQYMDICDRAYQFFEIFLSIVQSS